MVVELISKDKNERFQFQGRCKLTIDSVTKLLLVEPFHEEYKKISAMLKWEFNTLFILGENDFHDFALIFDTANICNKTYGFLIKKGATLGNKELIKNRFLHLLLENITTTSESNLKMKKILFQWIEEYDESKKQENVQSLQDNNINDLLPLNNNASNQQKDTRKRKAKDVHNQSGTQLNVNVKKFRGQKANITNKIVEKPNFEVLIYEHRNILYKRLIIFLDSSRSFCYEYYAKNDSKMYRCCGCNMKKHNIGACICQKKDGTKFVMLKSNQHVCETRKFNPEKYGKKEIVKAENFKLFKNIQNGKDKSKLVIFTSSDKRTCYEYFFCNGEKKFFCCGCHNKKKRIAAEIILNSDGSHYLKLNTKKHICETREYNPEKFEMSDKVVTASGFKLFEYMHNGTKISRLIVFCETNKNLCYEYSWKPYSRFYQCCHCPLKTAVTATIIKNVNSKDSVILSKAEHVCNLLEFDPKKYKDDIIIPKTMYEIASTTFGKTKIMLLNIFTSKEHNFCYKFVTKNKKKIYYCSTCRSSKITATIRNEDKENEIVYLSDQKHVCEPFEYFSTANGTIIMAPNYQLIKRKSHSKITQRMAVFTNEEKTECFEYTWNEEHKLFLCLSCKNRHNTKVYARFKRNDKNEECIELSLTTHKCKPIKFIPEDLTSNIVKQSGFKLFDSVFAGKTMKKLAVLDSENKKIGRIFTYLETKQRYICFRCNGQKTVITAKVHQDENGENYLELNKNEHVCEPQKI